MLWILCRPGVGGGGDSPRARLSAGNQAGSSGFPITIAHHSPLSPTFSGQARTISFLNLPKESLIVSGQAVPAVSCPRLNPINPGTPG